MAATRPSGPRAARGSQRGTRRQLKTLDRVLSKAGLGSRGDARRWIGERRVTVNGVTTTDADMWIDMARDQVCVDHVALTARERVYLALCKPVGYLTTYRDPQGRPTVYDLLADVGTFVSPIGRLDRDTAGLLLLTNDTRFADRVTSPSSHVPKTYRVLASKHLSGADLERLRDGLVLADGPTRPAIVTAAREQAGATRFDLTITEGRNRQVRRMVEALGATVVELTRLRVGTVTIRGLAAGSWRWLTASEVASFGGSRPAHRRRPARRRT